MALFSWIGTLCGNCNGSGEVNKETRVLPNTVVVTFTVLLVIINVIDGCAFLRKREMI